MPVRRGNNGMGTFTAMVIGAGVGIAAWETMRRRGAARTMGQVAGNVQNAVTNNQNR